MTNSEEISGEFEPPVPVDEPTEVAPPEVLPTIREQLTRHVPNEHRAEVLGVLTGQVPIHMIDNTPEDEGSE